MKFTTDTLSKAYAAMGENRFELPSLPGLPEEKQKYLQAHLDLPVFIEAINQESNGGKKWYPDYTDGNQVKIEAWFWIEKSDAHPSGFVFSITCYGNRLTITYGGARLAFHSYEAWQHAMQTQEVIDLFLTVMTKKK